MRMASGVHSRATYILPIKVSEPASTELTEYLRWLSRLMPVIVVDGSSTGVFAVHERLWSAYLTHIAPSSSTINGKVAGIVDGLAAISTPLAVIADDDVRYDEGALSRVIALLADNTVVVPQNYFAPLPWHARWDSARTLLNRALDHDFAGTAAVRRQALMETRGYCGAVLFENLEMLRTLSAHGYRILHADDVYVARRPPAFRHFAGQRVRQAFDSAAQPYRQLLELTGMPLLLLAAAREPWLLALAAAATMALAEAGRRKARGARVFPWHLPLWAPCWVVERSLCAWLAIASRACGGVTYAGQRLATSAHSTRRLAHGGCPELHCRCETVLRPRAYEPVAT